MIVISFKILYNAHMEENQNKEVLTTEMPIVEETPVVLEAPSIQITNKILSGSFKWMAVGLLISAVVSLITAMSPAFVNLILGTDYGFVIVILIELGIVIYLSRRIDKMSAVRAKNLFMAYSVLSGITLSVIFFAFNIISIISIFFGTMVMFSVLARYGKKTSYDLTKVGRIAYFSLIGLVVASVVNLFIGGTVLDYILAWVGVLVFTGLIMYDVQKLKNLGHAEMTEEEIKKARIIGALHLYLDFINLFLSLLRIFGKRR